MQFRIYLDLLVHVNRLSLSSPVSSLLVLLGGHGTTRIGTARHYKPPQGSGGFSSQALIMPASQRYKEERQVYLGLEQCYGMRRATLCGKSVS